MRSVGVRVVELVLGLAASLVAVAVHSWVLR